MFHVDEDRKDPAMYAPNGGLLWVKNLNADSTHPNPWRPPTIFEAAFPCFLNDMNLTTWNQPTLVKRELAFEKDGLSEKLRWYGIKSAALGNIFAVWDLAVLNSSQALPPLGKLARWAYLVTPWVGMSTTYVATHHILNKMVKKPNEPWIYAASWLSPATIWGAYKRSFGSFVRVACIGGFFGYSMKALSNYGIFAGEITMDGLNRDGSCNNPINDPLRGFAKGQGSWANRWMGGDNPSFPLRNYDEEFHGRKWQLEPSWKKHLPEEDRNKGPPTGL